MFLNHKENLTKREVRTMLVPQQNNQPGIVESLGNSLAFTGMVRSGNAGFSFGDTMSHDGLDELVAGLELHDLEAIRKLPRRDQEELRVGLSAMHYNRFTHTLYWRIVRDAVVLLRGKHCSDCGRCGSLQVHHATYEHHGQEHLYLTDLVLLCNQCHLMRHGLPNGTALIVMKVMDSISEKMEVVNA